MTSFADLGFVTILGIMTCIWNSTLITFHFISLNLSDILLSVRKVFLKNLKPDLTKVDTQAAASPKVRHSQIVTTQLRISHGVTANSPYLSSSPCKATSFWK